MAVEERMAKIEGSFEQTTLRINDLRQEINQRMDDLRQEMNQRFLSMNQRISDLKWEVRIWFVILALLMVLLQVLG